MARSGLTTTVEVGLQFGDRVWRWHLHPVHPRACWQSIARSVLRDYRPGECCERPARIMVRAPHLYPQVREWKLSGGRYVRV